MMCPPRLDHGDADCGVLEDGAKTRLAVAHRLFATLQFGDVGAGRDRRPVLQAHILDQEPAPIRRMPLMGEAEPVAFDLLLDRHFEVFRRYGGAFLGQSDQLGEGNAWNRRLADRYRLAEALVA